MSSKRILNPLMNQFLSTTLIHALRCPSQQPPQALLMCLRRSLFLHKLFRCIHCHIYHLYFCLFFSFLCGLLIASRLTYIFILTVPPHIHCLLRFSNFFISRRYVLYLHRYLLPLLLHFGSNFIPFLSAFCYFIYIVHSGVVQCTLIR